MWSARRVHDTSELRHLGSCGKSVYRLAFPYSETVGEVPSGCPEPHPSGSIEVHAVQLGAVRPRTSTDLAVRSEGLVVTGFRAIRCSSRACGAVVSERGLEPPRAISPLGPQPRSTGDRLPAWVHLQARRDAVRTRRAAAERSAVPLEVPSEVPSAPLRRTR